MPKGAKGGKKSHEQWWALRDRGKKKSREEISTLPEGGGRLGKSLIYTRIEKKACKQKRKEWT